MQIDVNTLKNMPPWEWPENAREVFLLELRDCEADESDRINAAEMAGDMVAVNDDIVRELLAIIESEDEPAMLRCAAAISLGPVLEEADLEEFEDPDAVPITEETFYKIIESLRRLYLDGSVPEKVRQSILQASVRSSKEWHRDAIRAAYFSGDEDWRATAVFAMRFIRGFDEQILEALNSANPLIHYNAVEAAGNRGLDAAWPHITELIESQDTDKHELIAAIEASIEIRPKEAGMLLVDLTHHDDGDIVDAAYENMAMAEAMTEAEESDELDDGDIDQLF